jgi:LPS-assembly protein
LEWRHPLVRQGETSSQLIEPITALIAAPPRLNKSTIPNEDSRGFDFDETDLFTRNRFRGIDQVDTGQRIDYGLRAAWYGHNVGTVQTLVGQSYRLQERNEFPAGSGLDDKLSDVVGRLVFTPNRFVDLAYRFRLDKDDLKPRRTEVGTSFGPDKLRFGINYISIEPQTTTAASTTTTTTSTAVRREQVSLNVSAGITRYWSVGVGGTRDLTGDQTTLSSFGSVSYADDCLTFIGSISSSGVRDTDVNPGTTILFTLIFKNLGTFVLPALQTGSSTTK